MAGIKIKQKIRNALKSAYFRDPDDLVDVSDGPGDSIHLVIVSRKFDGRRLKEKNDMIGHYSRRISSPRNGQEFRCRSERVRRTLKHLRGFSLLTKPVRGNASRGRSASPPNGQGGLDTLQDATNAVQPVRNGGNKI
jgi:hypothetical protein